MLKRKFQKAVIITSQPLQVISLNIALDVHSDKNSAFVFYCVSKADSLLSHPLSFTHTQSDLLSDDSDPKCLQQPEVSQLQASSQKS